MTSESGVVSRDSSGQKVVMGPSVFLLPMVRKLHTMDLSSRRIPVGTRGAVPKRGVKCDLEGVAIVNVGGPEDSIRAAAQQEQLLVDEAIAIAQRQLALKQAEITAAGALARAAQDQAVDVAARVPIAPDGDPAA